MNRFERPGKKNTERKILPEQGKTMPLEKNLADIAKMGREELKLRIKGFEGRFKLDFTDDYLNNLSVDKLRHIYLAALINLHKKA